MDDRGPCPLPHGWTCCMACDRPLRDLVFAESERSARFPRLRRVWAARAAGVTLPSSGPPEAATEVVQPPRDEARASRAMAKAREREVWEMVAECPDAGDAVGCKCYGQRYCRRGLGNKHGIVSKQQCFSCQDDLMRSDDGG